MRKIQMMAAAAVMAAVMAAGARAQDSHAIINTPAPFPGDPERVVQAFNDIPARLQLTSVAEMEGGRLGKMEKALADVASALAEMRSAVAALTNRTEKAEAPAGGPLAAEVKLLREQVEAVGRQVAESTPEALAAKAALLDIKHRNLAPLPGGQTDMTATNSVLTFSHPIKKRWRNADGTWSVTFRGK